MNIDVGTYIQELLYTNQQVVVPQFGAFKTTYATAVIQAHGYITPPSMVITFDNELFSNDQQLIEHIVQSETITYTEADKAIKDFINSIHTTLNHQQNQSFTIPQVGRLYLDLDEKLTFIPSGNNFLKEAYGLPKIQFFPISRQYTKAETPVPVTTPKPRATIFTQVIALWKDRYVRTIVIIILLLIIFVPPAFEYINRPQTITPSIIAEEIGNQENIIDQNEPFQPFPNSQNTAPPPKESFKPRRVNIKPQKEDKEIAKTADLKSADIKPVESKATTTPKAAPKPKKNITEPPKTTNEVVEQPTFIIIVGAYGQLGNANSAIKKIAKLGYTPDLGKSGKLHRVGIQLFCNPNELSGKLNTIRKHYKSAWVLR